MDLRLCISNCSQLMPTCHQPSNYTFVRRGWGRSSANTPFPNSLRIPPPQGPCRARSRWARCPGLGRRDTGKDTVHCAVPPQDTGACYWDRPLPVKLCHPLPEVPCQQVKLQIWVPRERESSEHQTTHENRMAGHKLRSRSGSWILWASMSPHA